MSKVLQFQPFSSSVDISFWHELSKRKLDIYRLSEEVIEVNGHFTFGQNPELPSRLMLDGDTFLVSSPSQYQCPMNHFQAIGQLYNVNTIEAFKNIDKKVLLDKTAELLWSDIISGRVIENPSLLVRFAVLSFADLKKHLFFHWFAFPAFILTNQQFTVESIQPLVQVYSTKQIEQLANHLKIGAFFLIKRTDDGLIIGHLNEWNKLFSDGSEINVGFVDPCALADHPGWPLRNFLTLLAIHWQVKKATVICVRDKAPTFSSSIVLNVNLPSISVDCIPQAVGWEKNKDDKLAPKVIDLSNMMDPSKLAITASELNLKLMKWRMVPSLDLERIANTRCLLLGSGTLGSNVARCLLGWGVHNITLVDNSKVSYSNPVRQSLFEFEDCLDGGKSKALAAAKRLKSIYPGVNARGVELSVPMPGHTITESNIDRVRADAQTLEQLISEHDAVFLLMDSRESRWLPSVLCNVHNKICINAALGFDSFMVMRHGASVLSQLPDGASERLACYFCSDGTAPQDSTSNRTIDQMCTVTRPGLSFLASAIAGELLVSLIDHPLRAHAAAETKVDFTSIKGDSLGIVPHQIRGFLSHFTNSLITGYSYERCTACSKQVIEAFMKEGFEFVFKVCNQPKYLEEISGLTKAIQEMEESILEWEPFDDDQDN